MEWFSDCNVTFAGGCSVLRSTPQMPHELGTFGLHVVCQSSKTQQNPTVLISDHLGT